MQSEPRLVQALLRQMAVLGRRPGRRAKLLPAQVDALPLEEVASLVATSRRLSSVLRRALRGIVRAASMCVLPTPEPTAPENLSQCMC